jgi:hypothetical protein
MPSPAWNEIADEVTACLADFHDIGNIANILSERALSDRERRDALIEQLFVAICGRIDCDASRGWSPAGTGDRDLDRKIRGAATEFINLKIANQKKVLREAERRAKFSWREPTNEERRLEVEILQLLQDEGGISRDDALYVVHASIKNGVAFERGVQEEFRALCASCVEARELRVLKYFIGPLESLPKPEEVGKRVLRLIGDRRIRRRTATSREGWAVEEAVATSIAAKVVNARELDLPALYDAIGGGTLRLGAERARQAHKDLPPMALQVLNEAVEGMVAGTNPITFEGVKQALIVAIMLQALRLCDELKDDEDVKRVFFKEVLFSPETQAVCRLLYGGESDKAGGDILKEAREKAKDEFYDAIFKLYQASLAKAGTEAEAREARRVLAQHVENPDKKTIFAALSRWGAGNKPGDMTWTELCELRANFRRWMDTLAVRDLLAERVATSFAHQDLRADCTLGAGVSGISDLFEVTATSMELLADKMALIAAVLVQEQEGKGDRARLRRASGLADVPLRLCEEVSRADGVFSDEGRRRLGEAVSAYETAGSDMERRACFPVLREAVEAIAEETPNLALLRSFEPASVIATAMPPDGFNREDRERLFSHIVNNFGFEPHLVVSAVLDHPLTETCSGSMEMASAWLVASDKGSLVDMAGHGSLVDIQLPDELSDNPTPRFVREATFTKRPVKWFNSDGTLHCVTSDAFHELYFVGEWVIPDLQEVAHVYEFVNSWKDAEVLFLGDKALRVKETQTIRTDHMALRKAGPAVRASGTLVPAAPLGAPRQNAPRVAS